MPEDDIVIVVLDSRKNNFRCRGMENAFSTTSDPVIRFTTSGASTVMMPMSVLLAQRVPGDEACARNALGVCQLDIIGGENLHHLASRVVRNGDPVNMHSEMVGSTLESPGSAVL